MISHGAEPHLAQA